MTRSFSSLSISNALCLTGVWILVALGIYATKMQKDQEQQDIYDLFNKTNWTIVKNDTEKFRQNLPSYYLPAQSLKTISKSLIWLGFVLDIAVCFTEFIVVWLKVKAPDFFYELSFYRYAVYCSHVMDLTYRLDIVNSSIDINVVLSSSVWILSRIFVAVFMCIVSNKLSNEVDGISNPVIHAIGPTGKKAMAGA